MGYRPGVLSTTLSHLIATGSAHLVVPFVPVRGFFPCRRGRSCLLFRQSLSVSLADFGIGLDVPGLVRTERLREKVEERFGCEFELFVEFTGLVR